MNNNYRLLIQAIEAAVAAGKAILEVYGSDDFQVEMKSDQSPLTLADKKAHDAITAHLAATALPVLSEESEHIPYNNRSHWKQFWLVDPLDGTKEFIKRNGEFTVNIALIDNQHPILGVVYAPVTDVMYFGTTDVGAFKLSGASGFNFSEQNPRSFASVLPCLHGSTYGIVASRSHMNQETSTFIEGLMRNYPDARIVSKGSSLKLCMIAEGEADIYPRFAPTMEWDTAAGHAVVNAAGGKVLLAGDENNELIYNKPDLLNPWFIALNSKQPRPS